MGGAVPCLGHPSRTAAVQALRTEGLPARVIAERIGISVKQVYSLEASAKRDRSTLAADGAGRRILPVAAADVLPTDFKLRALARQHAARRGYSIDRLLREVIETMLRDDIVDAVLDDIAALQEAS